jgi:selenocysteine-specific elongation factor
MKHVIVGTAGHIDHGKSALVQALTGTNPDRLEEEKRRGITIDLGFAFLELGELKIGFVDVPGHERFVRNMLAGAGGIDIVLMVIAADESIKPQTREHFDICRLLGIPSGIVVLTKSDLADPETRALAKIEIQELVRGSFLEGAPIVEVSSKTGAGLDSLKEELKKAAAKIINKNADHFFRLPIDRAFAMKGFGAVVTGTLISGTLQTEDELELFPAGRRVRVRGLHSGGSAVPTAVAGQRTAINLAGVKLEDLARGMTLASPGLFQCTSRFNARIHLLPSAPMLKNRSRVHFHCGAAEITAEIILLEEPALQPDQTTFAQLRLPSPFLLLPGDPFIIRRISPITTIGGGVVLDPFAPYHRSRDSHTLPLLKILEGADREAIAENLAALENQGLTISRLIARTGWSKKDAAAILATLLHQKQVIQIETDPLRVAHAAKIAEYGRQIVDQLKQFHRAEPLLPGLSKEDLRGRVKAHPKLFAAALAQLIEVGAVAVSGDLVHSAGHKIAATTDEARSLEKIEEIYKDAGLTSPTPDELFQKLPIDPRLGRRLFQILVTEGKIVKVTEALFFHKDAITRLRELIAKHRKTNGPHLKMGDFKTLAGVSRKYAVPLLEYLDRQGVTRRQGEERVILIP